ncbi:hypothetical protein [Pedobacter alluvionis]|nr:hypothetical protein [Pedobacter alluvionis]TFB29307.1 hypothetical protein E3V97_19870 [Pedobacter alluvionis]
MKPRRSYKKFAIPNKTVAQLESSDGNKKFFNFKNEFGWGEAISVLALVVAGLAFYWQVVDSKAEVSLVNIDRSGSSFVDKDKKNLLFGLTKATVINNSNRAVTLLGIKPRLYLGTGDERLDTIVNPQNHSIAYNIFIIPDSISPDTFFVNHQYINNFKNNQSKHLASINKVINSGEAYTISLGTLFDLANFKNYSSISFLADLEFSNKQILDFAICTPCLTNPSFKKKESETIIQLGK